MKKFWDGYNKLEEMLLAGSLIFTVVLIFAQVIMRHVFNNSLTWSEELARYIFIWQIWLGTSLGFRTNSHIKVDVFSGVLKGKSKIAFNFISKLLLLMFCVFLVSAGFELATSMFSRNAMSAAMRIPLWIIYASLPISQVVVSLRILSDMAEDAQVFFSNSCEGDL